MAIVAAAVVALAPQALAQGCAMCGTAVQNPRDPLARSMASSIYFMLSMPFLLFFTVAGWLVWRFRRARTRPGPLPHHGVIPEENPS